MYVSKMAKWPVGRALGGSSIESCGVARNEYKNVRNYNKMRKSSIIVSENAARKCHYTGCMLARYGINNVCVMAPS